MDGRQAVLDGIPGRVVGPRPQRRILSTPVQDPGTHRPGAHGGSLQGRAQPGPGGCRKGLAAFQGQEASTTAKDGKWLVQLDNLKAGGPFEMTIAGKNEIHLKNVYVGDVWICSGQSNMEMALFSTENAAKAIAGSKNPNIRLFTVPKIPAGTPRHEVPVVGGFPQNAQGKWLECGPQTTPNFTAVAYFFGRDLEKSLKVPIGLIHTSWGGTPAEAWTSKPALEKEPGRLALRQVGETFVCPS